MAAAESQVLGGECLDKLEVLAAVMKLWRTMSISSTWVASLHKVIGVSSQNAVGHQIPHVLVINESWRLNRGTG